MKNGLLKILKGYDSFRKKYALGDKSVMRYLSSNGQQPEIMVVACCDSRVDPALILQCEPGDLFVVRNVANIIPPYEIDDAHHGTSAALEFGICYLKVKHLILLGHSQCGGIHALVNGGTGSKNDFIDNWVSVIKPPHDANQDPDEYAKLALNQSLRNSLTFPWLKEKVANKELIVHQWFFDIKLGKIFTYSEEEEQFKPLDPVRLLQEVDVGS